MEQYSARTVSTIEALKSSIMTDPQVFRWFAFLIARPPVRDRLSHKQGAQTLYVKLRRNNFIANLLYFLLAACLAAVFFSRQYYYWAGAAILGGIIARANLLRKRCVAQIGGRLISDQIEDFERKTLFQISEVLSRSYHIPSLIDILCHLDNVRRRVLMGTFVLAFYILPFSVSGALCFMMVSYILFTAAVQSSFMMKHLK